uniref:Uncharacterized protein n=1 Tax=Anopheles christyi TaxID=43041 RepID=A0A182KH69_9DIPT
MDGSPPKTNRKVRFSLPEPAVPAVPSATPVQKQRMAHGTMQYVNGTLISQSQQTSGQSAAQQTRAHQSLQITPTPTSATSTIHGSSASTFKPKELNNKIVLHLRPSVSSLDSGSELSSPKGSPGNSSDAKTARQKAYAQKSGNSSLSLSGGAGGGRSLKSLPSINQKFPSSEDLNNNGGGANRQRSSDDLGPMIAGGLWNHPTKKPIIMLRTISSSGTQTHPAKASLTARARTKAVGKLPGSVGPGGRQTKSHLAPMDGMVVRCQESSTNNNRSGELNGGSESKDRRIEEINVSSIIRQSGQSTVGSNQHRSMYGKSGQFLAVPEYSDRYEGMETAVSATLNDDEEDEFEDSEQDGSGGSATGNGDERNGTVSDQAANGNDLLKGSIIDDGKFRCVRDTNLGRDRNTAQFWDFVERWRTNRALKKLESANHEPSAPVSTTVSIGSERNKSETKR